jgi:pyruvate formate lyase activating enzyme
VAFRVGLRKTSLVDYPGRIAATLFFPACNLRCPWCHNRELVLPRSEVEMGDGLFDLEDAVALIERRRTLLGGVVLSGGEPTLRSDLPSIIVRLKALGLPVKLDTNGLCPDVLENLFTDGNTRPDYVALDLKLSPDRYAELAQPIAAQDGVDSRDLASAIRKSAALLASSGIPHEFRSLALGDQVFTGKDVEALAPLVDDAPWYFAPFRPGNCLDEKWNDHPAKGADDARQLSELARSYGKKGEVRSSQV